MISDLADHEIQRLRRAKLVPPRTSSDLVPRPSLLEHLDRFSDRPLLFIAAPAGYGKSVLMTQWRQRLGDRGALTAWLSLDHTDANAGQFLVSLIYALECGGMDVGDLANAAANGFMGASYVLVQERIVSLATRLAAPVTVFVDDYHLAESKLIDDIIAHLIRNTDGRIRFCISSRNIMPLRFAALLVTAEAWEIGAALLRFSDDEVHAAVGVELDRETSGELLAKVEGWPVAVQLARVLIRNSADGRLSVSGLHGHTGHLASYLTTQVVEQMSEALQEFVLKTSILGSFNAALADAVCKRRNSVDLLKQLEPLHALLVPMDDGQSTFRYHHLFAECLQQLLERRFPGQSTGLHLRASHWFAGKRLYAEAVHHARAASRYDIYARWVCEAGGWEQILFGGIAYLSGLLENFPPDQLPSYPRLQLARAYLAIKNGEIKSARAYFDAATALRPVAELDAPTRRDYLNVRLLLAIYEDNEISDRNTDIPDRLFDWIEKDDAVSLVTYHVGRYFWLDKAGRFREGEEAVRLAMKFAREAGSMLCVNYCELHFGLVAFFTGEHRVATAHFDKAVTLAEDNFSADSGLKNICLIYAGVGKFWRGLSGPEDIRVLRNALRHSQAYDGWCVGFAIALDALFHHASHAGNLAEAEMLLAEMEKTAFERDIARLQLLCDAFRLIHFVELNDRPRAAICFDALKSRGLPDEGAASSRGGWMIRFFVGYAAGRYAASAQNYPEAMRWVRMAYAAAHAVGAEFFALRARIEEAVIHAETRRHREAVATLLPAILSASRSELLQPFFRPTLDRLLRSMRALEFSPHEDILVADFIAKILGKDGPGKGLFSEREREVLEELARGVSNKEIARVLDMTENTVKFHLKNIFLKLKVANRMQAITAARAHAYVD